MPLSGDEDQLVQVFQNLLTNARESVSANRPAKISLSAENIGIGDYGELPLQKGAYIKLTIKDNGCGMEDQVLAKAFDPYFSTKQLSSQKGVGLGLTVCYSVIKKHDGHIAIQSEPGLGTTVTLYLPAWQAAPLP